MDTPQGCTCQECSCVKKYKKKVKVQKQKDKLEWSKKLVADVRPLLWIVTIGGLLLAAMCIYKGFLGSLPWISTMVGLPWAAHGTICSFYLNMAKSDHKVGGITYEKAKANNFQNFTTINSYSGSCNNSPQI